MDNHQQQLRQGEPGKAALARRGDGSVNGIDLMRVDLRDEIGETGAPPIAGASSTVGVVVGVDGGLVDVSIEQEPKIVDGVSPAKRRRGRPPRGQAKTLPQPRPPPPRKMEDEEEDVCFICFDGGDLVLCDRRNCPKAYHPACIKRDEAFFQTKAKWNCGWHICSTCQKASSYMCYTCTYSVCKRCIKDANYVSVRGNMGLCAICMKTIMLIENVAQSDKETVKVDFDDKTSWEYLFKVYWLCLKEKLSLTLSELTKATTPWKEVSSVAPKVELGNELCDHSYNRVHSSENTCVDVAVDGTKRRRTSDSPTLLNMNTKNSGDNQEKLPRATEWATKELLEFVAYMKNGDISVLSQFDVQTLLLDYIKRKNLRDPREKSHVLCDSMLMRLFGKQRVGHFEMLKLLEFHFLIQENSPNAKTMNGEATHAIPHQMVEDGVEETTRSDQRRKTRKKAGDGVRNANKDEYAAIDVHNINLIYLRRKFLETLLDDIDKVHEKVVGTIVRIRVSGNDQKLDIHRLVQVVGTCKATESYQIGTRTTDVMLEILNLDKREVISIDQLSDQDITEDECKRLRQSIKCGLNKRFIVAEILEKAATLQSMRVSEALEAEILKLNYLRDRASENGYRKELRECIEKLELLKSPEERRRRMQEISEVHTDPSMNPCHASAEDAELGTIKQDNQIKTSSKNPQNKGDILNNLGNSAQRNFAAAFLRSKNVCTTFYADRDGSSNVQNSSDIQETVQEEEESEVWHYQDPTGKTQGPFSMAQLRRWKSSGHFPPYLRIWRSHEKQDDSVLLTDALAGRSNKANTLLSASMPSQELKLAVESGLDVTASSDKGVDNNHRENPTANNTSASSCSSSYVVPVAVTIQNERQKESLPSGVGKLASGGSHSFVKNIKDDGAHAASVSLNGSVHTPNLNQEIHFLDFSSPTPKSSPEDLETQAAETIQSLSSCVLVKGPSGVTWSTATTAATPSSIVVSGTQLPEVPQQNGAVMPPALVVKPAELSTEHVIATQTSDNTQVAHHSSGWPAIVADPDECDESVSDLLAEVEAMEQNGLPSSPTSTFHCDDDDDDDLTKGPEKDFFHPVARMSLATELCMSNGAEVDVLDSQNVYTSGTDPKESSKAMDAPPVSIHCETTTGLELPLFTQPVPPASISHDLTLTTTALRLGSEATVEGGALDDISKTEPSHKSGNEGTARGNNGQQQQQRNERERGTTGHRDRERQWWNHGSSGYSHTNRQWPYSSSGHASHPPRGLRICKFYENGRCKKGASCSFWHP
ncbi:PREDICTED: zinc finger CCCH domain-containing protein 44-like isoform X2 [Tarenaya hassleriana]|uniref:zinc finger CCCH domain-containing protein 44-like isoform X2 n=1 Tax=Tarenaya hassleriana TaxID=28532 RepID=UPI00053C6FF4|nr:PREDICTED: zinc finger CCCH domain-containing protein 44-like isoform X2 [Tarenaya hassleriana]